MRLPRFTTMLGDVKVLSETVRDIIAALSLVPDIELLEFETHANVSATAPLPIRLNRVGVPKYVAINAYAKAAPRDAVPCGSPSWQRTEDGIAVTDFDGLTAGTQYVVRMIVVGS